METFSVREYGPARQGKIIDVHGNEVVIEEGQML